MKADYSHNDKLPPLSESGKKELLEAFETWFTSLLLAEGYSCLERDVLRNQKANLKEEWLRVRPHYTTEDEVHLHELQRNKGAAPSGPKSAPM